MSAPAPPARAPRGDLADDLAVVALAVARHVAAGATLWCVAPTAPGHAAHLAVEFLHPVIMGKRAVPAVAVEGEGERVRRTLGTAVRAGDVLVLIGPAAHVELRALAWRGTAWGVTTLWLATGAGGAPIDADLVLRLPAGDDVDDAVELVTTYHLLWELTHVVFEHPGLLAPPEACAVREGRCTTCSDDGRLAEIVAVDGDQASVRMDGRRAEVAIGVVDAVEPGDLVVVHAGVAITKVEQASWVEEAS